MEFQPVFDFIRTLYPNRTTIPLHEPLFSGNEKKYMAECIDSTYVSSVGPFVGRFEEAIADFVGRVGDQDRVEPFYAVACTNGTVALHLALQVAGVQAGDEVITQPLSFIATANPIVYIGANPLFIDVDADTLGLSPNSLRAFLEQHTTLENGHCVNTRTGRRISACVPMHTFGNPCRIDEIVALCNDHHIVVIEDAAESIGSYYKQKHTGTFGLMGIMSFNGNKTITTGGGGMIITRDPSIAATLKHLSTQAKVPHPWEFAHDAIGYNYRLPNINAALGVAQMENIEEKLASKRQIAHQYQEFFTQLGLSTINEIPGAQSNFWLNGIFLNNRHQLDEFLQLSVNQNIQCRPAWNLLPTLPMYQQYPCEAIPNAIKIRETLVNIPSSPICSR